MKKGLIILCVMALLLSSSSCGMRTENVESTSVLETECQYNLINGSGMYFTETPDGIYFTDGMKLYFMDERMEPQILCRKPNCDHEDANTCAGVCLDAQGLYYYKGSLYIVQFRLNEELEMSIEERTLQGDYMRTVAIVPQSLQNIIIHRGVFYYTYYAENANEDAESMGSATLASFSLEDDSEIILYQHKTENDMLGHILAYKDKVYIRELVSDENGAVFNTLIYDTVTGNISKLNGVATVYFSGDKLLFNKMIDDWKTVYMSNLDGTEIVATELVLENDNGLYSVFDSYVIESNMIDYTDETLSNGTFLQSFRVYKDNAFQFDYILDDIDGVDWSKKVITNMITTDKTIFVILPDGSISAINKSDFEQGKIDPTVVFKP